MAYKRVKPTKNDDTFEIQSYCYNELSGGIKHLNVGPKLVNVGTITAATIIGKGKVVALWATAANTTVTIGNQSVSSLALGVGGIPLKQNDYTYLAMGDDQCIIASSANVFCFVISDDTEIRDY